MLTSPGTPPAKRTYDARSRRERAEQERADTRDRVLDAARQRFLAHGYAATKMIDIADEAGVAIASVYRAARSKAELIEMVLQRATTGDDPAQQLSSSPLAHPAYPPIAAEPDPQQQVRMITDRIAEVLDRVAPLWSVLRDAAGVDATAAAAMTTALQRRAASLEVAVSLLPEDRLRESPAESVDTLWALSSPETYMMLRSARGWSHTRYRDWLRRSLLVQLLIPVPPEPVHHPREERRRP
ncbi:MAG: helix-turn-helix domain-containing protein [Mycobacteriaceae bacterium]